MNFSSEDLKILEAGSAKRNRAKKRISAKKKVSQKRKLTSTYDPELYGVILSDGKNGMSQDNFFQCK